MAGSVADERLAWVVSDIAHAEPLQDLALEPQRVEPDTRLPVAKMRRPAFTLGRIIDWFECQLAIEARFGTAFVLTPVAFGFGAVCYFALPAEPATHSVAAGVLLALGLLFVCVKQQAPMAMTRVMIALVVVLAGLAAGQIRTKLLATPMVGSEVTTNLTGRVVTIERRANGTTRYTIDVIKTARPLLRYPPERVRVTSRGEQPAFRSGDGIAGRLRLSSPSGPFRPGGFDFAFHNYFVGIGANGFFYGAPSPVELGADEAQPPALLTLFRNLRMDLGARVGRVAGGVEGAAVSSALITGDKAPIPEETADALRLSGLAHILTISGLHMALVAGAVMIVVRAGLALFPDYASRRGTRKIAACWALAFVAVYLFLAGASVATQRSFIMLSVMLGALLMDRAAITMRNLAIAAMIVMLLAPEAMTGPSFQMSFAATAALIATYSAVSARAERRRAAFDPSLSPQLLGIPQTVMKYVLGLAVTAIVAGAATGLYSGYHFNRIAPYGLIANVLAVPIVSLITMPLGVIGMLAIPFGLDGFVFSAMAWSVQQVIAIADWVVGISPSGAIGVMPKPAMLSGSAGLLILCLLRSQLRWLALIPFAVSIILTLNRATPVVLITEDAKQLGVLLARPGGDTVLAVNRARPNGSTLEQWKPAYQYSEIVKPVEVERVDVMSEARQIDHIICDDDICLIDLPKTAATHVRLSYLKQAPTNSTEAKVHCEGSGIVIHAYAPAQTLCDTSVIEITAQDLALRGSAAIYLHNPKSAAATPQQPSITVRHAIGSNLRPWHQHRQFSRSARNLAPWKPKPRSQ